LKPRSTLLLYGLVTGVFALILAWWLVFFLRQGELLVSRADRAGAGLSPGQAEAVRAAAHQSLRMFLFEGGFLLLAFGAGVVLVLRSLRREIVLARQQREFLSAVTHELRTPLASARLALQSLRLGRVPPEKTQAYLDNTQADLERLTELVERVLESARVTRHPGRVPLELVTMDLAEFSGRTAHELVGRTAPGLALELAADAPVPVAADPSALETILRNLIANAAKYAGTPGRLRIDVRRDAREGVLRVRDFGPGVRGDAKKLFEPFARGDGPLVKSQPGVGLGLFLVAELARGLGGRVSARNADEGGFEVELRLPLVEGPA